MGVKKEKKTYLNPLGQKVVEVDFGYKVYDDKETDKVILYVGENTPEGRCIYLDSEAITAGEKEIAYMNSTVLREYEATLKTIQASNMSDDDAMRLIKNVNLGCGITGENLFGVLEEYDFQIDLLIETLKRL